MANPTKKAKAGKVTVQDRTLAAIRKVGFVTDKAISEFTEESMKLGRQLLRDLTKESTGKLANSMKTEKRGHMLYSIKTEANNEKGTGYGAAQEYGWHPKGGGKKVKGRFFIIRGTTGTIGKWKRGDRWKD